MIMHYASYIMCDKMDLRRIIFGKIKPASIPVGSVDKFGYGWYFVCALLISSKHSINIAYECRNQSITGQRMYV